MIETFCQEEDFEGVRLFFEDETRLGLKLPRYRRVTACGVRPVQPYQMRYQYYWLYGAVEPKTGEAFYLEMPALDVDCFTVYLAALSKQYAKTLNVLVVDGAPAHRGKDVVVPQNVILLFLPPYSPELNPVERLWLSLKQRLDVFDAAIRSELSVLRRHVADQVRALTASQLRSLTGYGYIRDALALHTNIKE